MGRGLGPAQRRVVNILLEASTSEGLPLGRLRTLAGGDKSNLRRTIRTLARRKLIEQVTVGGERRVSLTFSGALATMPRPSRKLDPIANLRTEWKEKECRIREARAEERRRLEAEAAKGPKWIGYGHRPVRRRRPGPTQERVLFILWEYTDPVDEGLPLLAVKAIVGGDRSNTRRAIRTLLLRGELDESEDGNRIRLAYGTALMFSIIPPVAPDTIDEERARGILRAH